MKDDRHNYEYQIDIHGSSAPARVVRMVGANKRVLEIGAGPGSITRVLTHNNNCTVTALERDQSAIKKLSSFCEKVIHADLNDPTWPYLIPNEPVFDVLVCADVLEHVYEPTTVLSAIAKLLGPEASLVVSLPHVGHSAIHACLFDSDFEYRDSGLLDRTHIRFFGLTNIAELFSGAGLKIVEAEFVTCEPEQTEFALRWAKLPEALKQALRANPYGTVYQVVVRAVPMASKQSSINLRYVKFIDGLPPQRIWQQRLRNFARRHLSPEARARIRRLINSLGI
jgi:2-polyprenyl-3-methyl-5-hydroxy-6-metoxy-1,4-benzoquinol methylase